MTISRKQPQESVREKMQELMEPIDQQIMMTDDRNELLMIACAMLHRSKEISKENNNSSNSQILGPLDAVSERGINLLQYGT